MLVAGLSVVGAAPGAFAQSGSELATSSDFGNTGQGDATIVGQYGQGLANNACVPTADANGMMYLQNYWEATYGQSLFAAPPSSGTAVNSLISDMGTTANGTTINGEFSGLQNYLAANPAPNVRVTGQYSPSIPSGWLTSSPAIPAGPYVQNVQNVTPTAQYLATALNANDGVEVGIQWGSLANNAFTTSGTGGHQLTLEQISWNSSTGTGTATFIDPWGSETSVAPGATAGELTGTLCSIDGNLVVSFNSLSPNGYTAASESNDSAIGHGNHVESGVILEDTVEYVVPEPATYLAAVLMLVPFGTSALKQQRASRRAG